MKRIFIATLLVAFSLFLKAQPVLKNLSLTDLGLDMFYIGVENELVLEGVPDKKSVEVLMDDRVVEEYNGRYQAKAYKTGTVKVEVYQKGKKGRQLLLSKIYQTKTIPYPQARVVGAKDSILSIAYLTTNPQLEVYFPDSYFTSVVGIMSFSLEITDPNGEIELAQTSSSGNRMSDMMIAKLKDLKSRDKLVFNEIRVATPEGRIQKLPPLTVYVR